MPGMKPKQQDWKIQKKPSPLLPTYFWRTCSGENDQTLRRWKALQAKDLFERSLKINPDNDSANIGLGACYIFGNISATPMEGILKVREVAEKDSTNIYAQNVLGQGSLYIRTI